MENFSDYVAKDRRLGILLLLQKSQAHRLNHRVITVGLEHLGHISSRSMVSQDLVILAKERLITRIEHEGSPTIAILTNRGLDVLRGSLYVNSVNSPPLAT